MYILIKKRRSHGEGCITVEVSGKWQKVETHPANEGSGRAFFGIQSGCFFGFDLGKVFGVMLR